MPKLIMTKGLPASGKSTWAKAQVDKGNGRVKRINKDELRDMVDAGQWSKKNEEEILEVRDHLIHVFLQDGYDVIVDDTNLHPKHEVALREIADAEGATFLIQDFTSVPLQTCIDRDSARGEKSVGQTVIKRMHTSFLEGKGHVAKYTKEKLCQDLTEIVTSILSATSKPSLLNRDEIHDAVNSVVKAPENTDSKFIIQNMMERLSQTSNSSASRATTKRKIQTYSEPPYNPDLPDCIIVDIDGTLAHMNGRSPFDYSKVSTDVVDPQVAEIVRKYAQRDIQDLPDCYVVIVSGRDAVCMPETTTWLTEHNIPYDELHMRPEGDKRKDSIVKQEIYDKYIKDRYNVKFVLDDRNQVVDMWREIGLKVLQAAPGDF